jgi:PAS domain S-box-containing protein
MCRYGDKSADSSIQIAKEDNGAPMALTNRGPEKFDELRSRAEELLRQRSEEAHPSSPGGDLLELIHELKVHQAELEIQNEELKRSQEELAELHRKYEDLFELAPCGYVTLNAKGIITRANLTAARLLGTEKQILSYSVFSRFIADHGRSAFQKALKQAVQTGEKQTLELPLNRRNDAPTWVLAEIHVDFDESGQADQRRVTLADITERKWTEEMLRENESKLQAIIDQTADMLFLHDLKGNILEVNERAVNQSGYSREELLSMRIADLDPDYDLREEGGRFWERLDWSRPQTFEARHLRKDATIFPVEVTISLVRLGGAPRIVALARDITNRKRHETSLLRAKEHAEQANSAKSDFLAKMSHEIRTPMNSILGMLRLALSDEMPEKQRERLQVAKGSAESLLWLLNDLLDLSKIEAGHFSLHKKEFRLRRLLGNVLKEMELLASEKGVSLSMSVDRELPTNLVGDPYRLKRILINLLSNAIKFTQEGWVALEARQLEIAPCLEKDDLLTTTVLFKVEDTGKGIDTEHLQAIFESYDQGGHVAHSAEQGTGLGLAICQRLTQQMGGSIWAESEPGAGSVFYVKIPLETDGEIAEEAEPCSEAETGEELPSLRLLLVEDERMNQIFTVDLLSSKGHRVEIAEDGRVALELLSRKSFDAVLMDIKLPVMDGIEAAMRIRTADPVEMNPGIPIIGLSAHVATEQELQRFRSAGFDEYVTKPVSFEKLFQAMSNIFPRQRSQGLR